MEITGVTQVPYAVNNFYDRSLLERAVAAFIHDQFADVRDIPQGNTDTVKFRKYDNLAAATTPLVAGVTPSGSSLSVTDITATVKQYGDYVTTDDFVQLTTLDPLLMETAGILGDQAGDTLDQLMRDILNAGTNVLYASTATDRDEVTAAMKLTNTEAKEATRQLKENNAKRIATRINPTTGYNTMPIPASYFGFVHPNTTNDLKDTAGYTPVHKYSNPTQALPNEVGSLDEIRLIESTNAKIFTGAGASGADVYSTVVVAMHAYAKTRISGAAMKNIIKPLGSAGTADPLNQRATSGWKATHVAVRLNESYMLRIEHGTSQS